MESISSISGDGEAQLHSTAKPEHNGWITFPFMTATLAGFTLGAGGWLSNLIVYMIEEFHKNSIESAQIHNLGIGCTSLFPIVGAIVADSFLTLSSGFPLISVLGLLFLLMETVNGFRPQNCQNASTAIVYVEDRVSWAWGFGKCIMANVLGIIIFLLGRRYYYYDKPKGSQFTSLAQLFRNFQISSRFCCSLHTSHHCNMPLSLIVSSGQYGRKLSAKMLLHCNESALATCLTLPAWQFQPWSRRKGVTQPIPTTFKVLKRDCSKAVRVFYSFSEFFAATVNAN
ncbi:unnamed protein product [Fraxinus pennsylvanica]|uniref:Uncharacterized protein n=1 Tax=Fraxinus pennsylvanica TaxID=56036 RepID=A0AAD1ZVW6_9LAMI|nr:unnamed protein product [Fraxinus pennsylvanica]